MKTGTTRCPECCERLSLTDWDDPDVVIVLHSYMEHDMELPHWMEVQYVWED